MKMTDFLEELKGVAEDMKKQEKKWQENSTKRKYR
jgi:hypothetical protein